MARRTAKTSAKTDDLVTRRTLATRLKVHMQTVTKWERAGLPIAERGRRGKPSRYRETDVQSWLANQTTPGHLSATELALRARARKDTAQAVLAEQTHETRTGDSLPKAEVEKVWGAHVAAVRTRLLAWAATLMDRLYRAAINEGAPGMERVLMAAVREILTELAS